jgi:hypothetical protein
MFKEHDVIKTTKIIENKLIPIGTHGTIIHIWNDCTFCIEFCPENPETEETYIEDLTISEIELI